MTSMEDEVNSEYPDHITVISGLKSKYAAAEMEWNEKEERYVPRWTGGWTTKSVAELEAQQRATTTGLELRNAGMIPV